MEQDETNVNVKCSKNQVAKCNKRTSAGLHVHLNVDTVWMVALSTLHTCYQLAFLTNTVAAAAQTHVLL